jgi:hypothetical protein
MGVEGLEPSRPSSQQILSLLCLPFHHTPNSQAAPGFEPGVKDLQSSALPLGHAALRISYNNSTIFFFLRIGKS